MEVVYEPPVEPRKKRPEQWQARQFRVGTIVRHEGNLWKVAQETMPPYDIYWELHEGPVPS